MHDKNTSAARESARSLLLRYAFSVLLLSGAVALRASLNPWLGDSLSHPTVFLAILLSGWYFGLGPAILNVILGYFAVEYLVLSPKSGAGFGQILATVGLYLLLSVIILAFVKRLKVERRATEESQAAYRDSEERWKRLIEGVKDYGIFMLDVDGRVSTWNSGAERLDGYNAEEIIGEDMSRFYSAEDRESGRPASNLKIARENGVHVYEGWRMRKDGTRFWANEYLATVADDAGRLRGFAQVVLDMTERMQAEEALRRSEAHLKTTLENLDEGVIASDLEGRITRCNVAALQMHGFTDLEAAREKLFDFEDTFEIFDLEGRALPPDEQPLARVLRGEKLHEWEVRINRKIASRGWPRTFSYGGTLVRDAEGNPLVAVYTVEDISERKQAEEELRRLKDELELRVDQRTADLAAANKELEAFTYSVSHDLRAPLRHVMSFVELLKKHIKETSDDKSRHYVEVISDAAQRMGVLIDDLLTLSRLGRAEMIEAEVDLRQIVEEARQLLAPELAGRDIEWQIERLPRVRGDRTLLRSAVLNLLSNAVKYTRCRHPARIEVKCEANNGKEMCLVRDNGAGFDMRYADKLFGVFQRLHRVEEFEGTGIGLASVRRIIERHGGKTWAEGSPDRGATFYFSLPRAEERT